MFKRNIKLVLVTGITVLIPLLAGILLWKSLPEQIAISFDNNGDASGYGSRVFAVCGMPVLLLAAHLLCAGITNFDPRRQNIGEKMYRIILWVVPFCSILVGSAVYSNAMQVQFESVRFVYIFLGMLLLVAGYNYQEGSTATFAIVLPWIKDHSCESEKVRNVIGICWMVCGETVLLASYMGANRMLIAGGALLLMAAVTMIGSTIALKNHSKRE